MDISLNILKAFTGKHPFSDFTDMVAVSKIMDGERPLRPREAQELGLTDSVWDMTLRCWQRDPAHRPAIMEVVGSLRERSVYCLSNGTSTVTCSYRLCVANLPSPTLAPRQPAENRDGASRHLGLSALFKFLMPSDSGSQPQSPTIRQDLCEVSHLERFKRPPREEGPDTPTRFAENVRNSSRETGPSIRSVVERAQKPSSSHANCLDARKTVNQCSAGSVRLDTQSKL